MDLFSVDYQAARKRFRAASIAAGAAVFSLPLDVKGAQEEDLSTDIAWLGNPAATRLLIHVSGLHGVEGFAGSAIQLQVLRQPPAVAEDCALLLIHVLNPFGMSWLRRVNETNIDLNRNFLFEPSPGPQVAAAYIRLNSLLNPQGEPEVDLFYLRALWNLLRFGYAPLKAAVACGQYVYPRGLFYGGEILAPGLQSYRDWLKEQVRDPQHLLVIDLHTGLGKFTQESLFQSLVATPAAGLAASPGVNICSEQQRRVIGYRVRGGHDELYRHLFPDCSVDFITHEFGTRPALQVLSALRNENRWHHFGAGELEHPAKRHLQQVFCPSNERWRLQVVEKGYALLTRGLNFLATG